MDEYDSNVPMDAEGTENGHQQSDALDELFEDAEEGNYGPPSTSQVELNIPTTEDKEHITIPEDEESEPEEQSERSSPFNGTDEDLFAEDDMLEEGHYQRAHFSPKEAEEESKPFFDLPERFTIPKGSMLVKDEEDSYFLRWPKFLHVHSAAYDDATFPFRDYFNEEEEEEVATTRLALTLLWKHNKSNDGRKDIDGDKEGSRSIQSNSHFVQWSDSSWSLVIGKEIFDVSIQTIEKQHKSLYTSVGVPAPEEPIAGSIFDQPSITLSGMAECCAPPLRHTLSIKVPTALRGVSRKWTHTAGARIQCITREVDPAAEHRRIESALLEKEKMEQLKKRHARKDSNKAQNALRKVYATGKMDKSFLEDDDDSDAENDNYSDAKGSRRKLQAAAKKKTSKRRQYQESEDEEDDEESEDEDYESEGEEEEEEESEAQSSDDSDANKGEIQFSSADDSEVDEKSKAASNISSTVPGKLSKPPAKASRIVFSDDDGD